VPKGKGEDKSISIKSRRVRGDSDNGKEWSRSARSAYKPKNKPNKKTTKETKLNESLQQRGFIYLS